MPGTRSVFAERTGGGFFLDFEWNRDELARYGLSVEEAQTVVQNAIGGENVTTTVEGRARYPVNVRYMRDFRSDLDALGRVLVPVAGGQRQIPLGQLATIKVATGPAMIRNEDGLLTGYVYVDLAGRDPGGYVRRGGRLLREKVKLPAGLRALWSGQYEAMARVRERLTLVVPSRCFLILLLLYLNTRSLVKTVIVVARGAVLGHRRRLVPLPARLQHERRRLGRADRAARRGRRDRRLHAALPRPRLRAGAQGGAAAHRSPTCARPSWRAR